MRRYRALKYSGRREAGGWGRDIILIWASEQTQYSSIHTLQSHARTDTGGSLSKALTIYKIGRLNLEKKKNLSQGLFTLFVTNFSLSLSCTVIFSGLLFYCERFALNNDIILETKLYLDSFASQVITPNIAGNLNCSLCWDDIIKSLKSVVSLSHISELGYIVLISASIKQMAGHKALHS